jgi:hypothetical protein
MPGKKWQNYVVSIDEGRLRLTVREILHRFVNGWCLVAVAVAAPGRSASGHSSPARFSFSAGLVSGIFIPADRSRWLFLLPFVVLLLSV